jgi:hypothetical protein
MLQAGTCVLLEHAEAGNWFSLNSLSCSMPMDSIPCPSASANTKLLNVGWSSMIDQRR